MSLIYYFVISKIGYFKLGRFVDLFQQDLQIVLLVFILYYAVRKWNKIWK